MNLALNWAKDFADFHCTAQEYADKMTMTGSKVETFERLGDKLENVVIGKVAALEKHPDSDHLWICQVDTGSGENIQIVTGAQNLKAGDICPVALHGSSLPNGTKIKKGKLRGIESNGMLCSLDELCLDTHDFPYAVEDGILVFTEEELSGIKLGDNAAKVLGMDDYSFEFEITPNRPDCLSVRALARESAATFGVPFKDHIPAEPEGKGDVNKHLKAEILEDSLCYRYCGAMVENVRIKPSPPWLRQRLRLCGVRPINNIVDITNYVMLEYGQPMHAFDYAYVNGGKISVRMAEENEKIVTLDGVERSLNENMLVISDEKGPIALAGVMGGEFSGVYDSTEKIVFESACFNGASVRQTSRRLGLRTESSGRFEKGLNPENALPALKRALELVKELDAGDIIGGIIDVYPSPRTERRVELCPGLINKLLGVEISTEEMINILVPLGFVPDGDFMIVPPERYDVSIYNDFAEEIARFIGYNKIPSETLVGQASARRSPRQDFDREICAVMAGYGFWECETFSFYSPKAFDMINLEKDSPLRRVVKIMNPLGEETSIMRTSALPSIMEVAARNWASRNETACLFEYATEYMPNESSEALPDEIRKFIIAVYGSKNSGGWDYLGLKGVVEGLLQKAGISDYEFRRAADNPSYHPGRSASVWVNWHGKENRVGIIGEIHPSVCANYGIKPRVIAADINMDMVFSFRGGVPEYRQLPKFPAITRDLALVADIDMPAAGIEKTIRRSVGKTLEKLSLFDVYTGEKLESGKKSLAYSLVLRSESQTLTDEEADKACKKILDNLAKDGVVLRS